MSNLKIFIEQINWVLWAVWFIIVFVVTTIIILTKAFENHAKKIAAISVWLFSIGIFGGILLGHEAVAYFSLITLSSIVASIVFVKLFS